MVKLRSIIFWLHLAAGIVAGIVIAVMSFTGAGLAFEKEIVAWTDRDVRWVRGEFSGDALRLDDLILRVRTSQAVAMPSSIVIQADPRATVAMSFGRTNTLHINPYTAEVQPESGRKVRQFMQTMLEWHRWLGRGETSRPAGKAVTGAANLVFLVLAITGLYLWWPRKWSRSSVRAVALLNWRLRSKARDWNWHNSIGLWSAPVLIVLTATALPMSYTWANNLIYRMTGTQPPAGGMAPGGSESSRGSEKHEGKPLPMASLLQAAQAAEPAWQQITIRTVGGGARGGGESRRGDRKEGERRGGAPALTLAVKKKNAWPLFSTVQLTLDPTTGAILRRESFADFNLGRQVRSWTRFLHTGEALGKVGQAVAGLACLGALILVYTGFALAWRRFFQPRGGEEAEAFIATTPSERRPDITGD